MGRNDRRYLKTICIDGELPFDKLRANESPMVPFVLSLSKHLGPPAHAAAP